MAAIKTRVTCPHCGRSITLRSDGHGIARHGPHKFTNYSRRPPCPGTGITPVDGPLTDKQLEFTRYCWHTGDALPVARLFNTSYTAPDLNPNISVDDVDMVVDFLKDEARSWILQVVRDYRTGVAA